MSAYNFTPFPELKTDQLLLRKLRETDAKELLFLRSDETVMQFIDREKTKTEAEALAFIHSINNAIKNNESILWGITLLHEPEKLVGTICFWNIRPENHRAETGYMLHPLYWGKGLMKEALLAVIGFGFSRMNLHSIEAQVNPENKSSIMLLEKTGFVREGLFKENICFRGKFKDTAVYSLLEP